MITFGSETVQTFRRLGDAEGEIYSLDGGMLALVDGRFVLVAARDDGVVTGCGAFEREGDYYTLEVLRWAEAQATKVVLPAQRHDDRELRRYTTHIVGWRELPSEIDRPRPVPKLGPARH